MNKTIVFDMDGTIADLYAVDNWLSFVQLHEIVADVIFPHNTVIQPRKLILGVGGIAAHQVEVLVLGGDDTALVAVLVDAEVVGDAQRLLPGKNSRAGVAGLVGAVPEAGIAGQVELRLLRPHLRLLQADDVGVGEVTEVQKAFIQTGPQAVDVPGNQSHGQFLSFSVLL